MKKVNLRIWIKGRVLLVLGTLSFIAVFQWIYISWLFPTFGYMGFDYDPPPMEYLALGGILGVLPSFWMPVKITRPSQLIYWVLYLVVIIPSMFVPLYMNIRPPLEVAGLMLTLFVGFVLTGLSYLLPPLRNRLLASSKVIFWHGLTCVILALSAWVIVVYLGQFKLVSFYEVYDKIRFSGAAVAEGTGVGYAVMWLSGAFNPFLMTWGLTHKRPLLFLTGAMGQVMLYATAGMKSVVLSILFIPLIFLILRNKLDSFGLKLTWGVVMLYVSLGLFITIAEDEIAESLFIIPSLIFMRTFGMPGMLTGLYHDFFQDHPFTYLSHVNLIKSLVDYPYQYPLGQEIGYFYYGSTDANANVHFWCTDGLAGFGFPGVLMVSLLCGFVFWVLDSVAARHNIVFTTLVVSFAALNISNGSLFTSLLSGGLGLSILLLYLMPQEAEKRITTERGLMKVLKMSGVKIQELIRTSDRGSACI